MSVNAPDKAGPNSIRGGADSESEWRPDREIEGTLLGMKYIGVGA